jgi:two-component system, NarL family, sensor histidine kinase DegS
LGVSVNDPLPNDAPAELPRLEQRQAALVNGQWEQERFVARARALFFARMMFLILGFLLLAIPAWAEHFGLRGPFALACYLAMLMYSVANYLVIGHPVAGRLVTYVTLCLDLLMTVVLLAKPQVGGGLQSPFLATQLLFTTLFAILFPRPLAILPPLLLLPITTRLDLLLEREVTAIALLTVLWYSALNFIIVYVIVYLNEREASANREILGLQKELQEVAVLDERARIAREIHDGLGASLSSLIIQSEYLLQLAPEEPLRGEITELKRSAEDAIDELRRNLRMMRDDFDLALGLEDYVQTFREKVGLDVQFSQEGRVPRLSPEAQLALFRILQEALQNCVKHAAASQVKVNVAFAPRQIAMSVRDDGKGFDPTVSKNGHYGLLNMRERATKLGAHLVVDSRPGGGTSLTLMLPVPE